MTAFSWEKLEKPIVCLAPMAGYTDSAYRQIVKSIAPETICFSELTSINAIGHNSQKTEEMLKFAEIEQPLIIQLFGKDPDFFVKAGKKLEHLKVSGIDINMGCPAKKVVCSEYGSALLNNPQLAGEIVNKLSKAIKIPVSVKMRIGYKTYDEQKFTEFVKILEQAGAQAITIHGRTTKQGYSGEADWAPIHLAKTLIKIPVIGNGDIDTPETAQKRLENLDGIMIGRATVGNPWLLREIHEKLHSEKPTKSPETLEQKLPTIKKHLHLAIKTYGEKIGILEMRKHLAGYISSIPGAKSLRVKLMQAPSEEEVLKILGDFL
ncbi:tRNA dihydrouridine synthase DusB [Candidatus Peregrinibacteria bacterium]|jgi:tRNA-dihydrouridine synthase B|nr:tRNA dihydrouridine synthase DusB [Candidatus Peregrinibacteria bacterium]MBT4056092.1 tRNA dihydrouridine synthase DusB [Candidatus Peregrinibacteria bacterium]